MPAGPEVDYRLLAEQLEAELRSDGAGDDEIAAALGGVDIDVKALAEVDLAAFFRLMKLTALKIRRM